MINTDFQCEKRLRELNPRYSQLVKDTAAVSSVFLEKYCTYFPDYTNHSVNHSLQVMDFCNRMIGNQVGMLNADEIYVLIMACYLHDWGMGISERDYSELKGRIVAEEYLEDHPDAGETDIIRDFHHDFSGALIEKYAELFEIPSKEHMHAIVQVARGHRRVDLFDEKEYPSRYALPNGNTICLPYLSALIRLADELDIAADRNLLVEYHNYFHAIHFRKHFYIKHLEIEDERFVLTISAEVDEQAGKLIEECVEKLRKTLDECIRVIEERTPYSISQKKLDIEYK